MRYSLLLITALTMPAHAELHEPSVITNNAVPTPTAPYNLTSNPNLLAKSLCWLPTSLTDRPKNCLVEAVQGSFVSMQNGSGVFDTFGVSWPTLHFPTIGNSSWSFVADMGYQFLLKTSSGDQLGKQLDSSANAAPLASMPLATVTWFVLGGMLGSLAMTRRRLTKLATING